MGNFGHEGLVEAEYKEGKREHRYGTEEAEFVAECESILDGKEEIRDEVARDHANDDRI